MEKIFSGTGNSGRYDLTFLYKKDKIYLMDNHMAAAWCWGQELDFQKSYNIFHIDKHYDLLSSNKEYIDSLEFDLGEMSIQEYIDLKDSRDEQVFQFDNYLTILNFKYPNLFNEKKFATHNDGTIPAEWNFYEPEIYDLTTGNISYWIKEDKKKWIVNIDIDYFFHKNLEDYYFQFLTDEYIINIAKDLKTVWANIAVLTIALSPNFCGGIENAERIANLIVEVLE